MRRELWETLMDMMRAIDPDVAGQYGMAIQDVILDLPVEVVVRHSEDSFYLLVDMPQRRWTGGIQLQPGRMMVRLEGMNNDEL